MAIPLACAQMACTPFDPTANRDKADQLIQEAAQLGARLILLPELLTTGYCYDRRLLDFAEPVGGATTGWMQRRSRQLGRWIGAGIVERSEEGIFDTLLLTGPAGEVHSYRKQYPAFLEYLYFQRGRSLGVFDTSLGRIGVMVCWDMIQARLCRELSSRIDLLLICSAWPDLRPANIPLYGVRDWVSRQPLQRPPQLARDLAIPVLYCNTTGPFVTPVPWLGLTFRSQFVGGSSITSHNGLRAAAMGHEEAVLVADVAVGKSSMKRLVA
jgi:predicted amidohydrolase